MEQNSSQWCPVIGQEAMGTHQNTEFCLNTIKLFFTVRVDKHWNRSSRKGVESTSLEIFKNFLDTVMGNLV